MRYAGQSWGALTSVNSFGIGHLVAKKSVVVVSTNGEKVPFLRGILVQSLVEAGLGFDDAYAMAQRVREAVAEVDGMPAGELRRVVAEHLEQHCGKRIRRAYELRQGGSREVLVRTSSGTAPFSVGLMSRYLEGCAIEREQALSCARTVQEILLQRNAQEIDTKELRRVIYETLNRDCCAQAGDRYLSRCHFEDSRQPLILLVGGPPGSGKSTVASALAYLFEITHTQSTDMMREIIRCYLAPHVVPALGYSSFEAWRGLPDVELESGRRQTDNPVIAGFLSQAATVRVALEATIDRALKEHRDIIVDGVHVLPSQMNLDEAREHAVVVPVVVAVTTIEKLGQRLRGRSREQPNRNSSRDKEDLEAIWDIQTFMLDQAQRSNVPVFINWNPDETAHQVLEEVMNRISERFPADPAKLQAQITK